MDTKVEGTDPLLGSNIAGRYTVMRRIARGGMGVVYLAVQDGLQRTVALKIIRPDAARDRVMQKRFEREARAVSQLAHPNIVTVYDFGKTDDGALFLAMEFVDGEVLRDALKRKRAFAFAETLPIVEAIASALARAHAAGVVHRDLKPENVMLPKQSASTTGAVVAKVLDFGLAKPHDPDAVDEHLTRDGGFVGTPGYAAPEQMEGAPESPQQDLYALGVVWFELLAGAHPFAAPTPMKTVARQLVEEPPALDPARADVPPSAAALIRRLLARKPDDRPPSAQAVLDDLRALRSAAGDPPIAAPPAPTPVGSAALSPLPAAKTPAATINDRPKFVPIVDEPASKVPWIVAGLLVAAGTAVVALVAHNTDAPPTIAADAGVDVVKPVHHHGEQSGVTVMLDDVPTFSALEAVRASLPTSGLIRYTRARSVLDIEDVPASTIAETLQGRALIGDVPLVFEVKELEPHHVIVAAVPPEQASELKDAGLLLDGGSFADAGKVDVVPGGLAP